MKALPTTKALSVLATAILALVLLPSCESTRYDPQPAMTFSHIKPVRLMVNDVQIVKTFTAPLQAPNIEHELVLKPADALRQWAAAKFQPALSGDHHLRVSIRDASVVKEVIETDDGFTAIFTDEQKSRYIARADILVEIYRGSALSRLAWVEAKASRQRTTPESTSLRDRDDIMFEVTESLIQEIDTKIGEAVRLHFAPFLIQ